MALKQIVIEFLSDTRQLQSGMKRTKRGVDSVTSAAKKLAAALGIAFSARAAFRFFNQTIESTNVLIKSAKGLDFTVGQYQQLAFALGQVGVEAGSAENAVIGFQRRLSKAVAGDKASRKAFLKAGLDPKALAAMSPSAAFDAAFAKLAGNVGDPRAAGIFGGIFGNLAASNMLKAARQLEDYKKAREDFARRVPTLSKEEEKAFEGVGDQIDLLKAQWGGLKQKIVVEAIPTISESLQKLDESGALKTMAEDIGKIVHAIAMLIDKMAELRKTLPETLPKTKIAKALGGQGGFKIEGMTIQERAEAAAETHRRRFLYRPGLINPMSEAQVNYYNQYNNISVRDGDQAKATTRLLEKEKRLSQ